MDPQPRTFTREEAEALLPEVDRLLAEAHKFVEALAHDIRGLIQENLLELVAGRRSVWLG